MGQNEKCPWKMHYSMIESGLSHFLNGTLGQKIKVKRKVCNH